MRYCMEQRGDLPIRSHLTSRDKIVAAGALASALACAWILNRAGGLLYFVVALIVLLGVFQLELYRRNLQFEEVNEQNQVQLDSLFSIFQLIRLNAPLPSMRGWSVRPDFVNLMIGVLREHKPRVTLELGCGVSSLVAGYVVKAWGGKIISLEHSDRFAAMTQEEVRRHGLEDVVKIFSVPLKNISVQGRNYLWYDTSKLDNFLSIDAVIVDGPPGTLQKLSRYPALPVLRDRLSSDAVILLDDAAREDETKIVELWQSESDRAECRYVATEKGAAVLRLNGNTAAKAAIA